MIRHDYGTVLSPPADITTRAVGLYTLIELPPVRTGVPFEFIQERHDTCDAVSSNCLLLEPPIAAGYEAA